MSNDHQRGDSLIAPPPPAGPNRSGWTRARIAASAVIVVLGGVVLASRMVHSGAPPGQTDDHGPLTDHEFVVAVAVARQEVDKLGLPITSATATVGEGTVADSNTGHPCTSGTLLHIKLTGDFPTIVHGGIPGQPYEPTSAVLITADPESEGVVSSACRPVSRNQRRVLSCCSPSNWRSAHATHDGQEFPLIGKSERIAADPDGRSARAGTRAGRPSDTTGRTWAGWF
jgi:hypothetical protein